MKENIIRFKISMHDVVLVKNLKSFKELLEDKKSFFLFQSSLFSQQSFKGASIAILIHEVEVVLSFEHVVVCNDMFVLLDVGKDVDFMHSAFL